MKMTNEPLVSVEPTRRFRRELKRLRKKYRSIDEDVKPLIEQLQNGETPAY
jgi:mRNA-degrading endonuclease RelE of RelBE toxin-antitoxin system